MKHIKVFSACLLVGSMFAVAGCTIGGSGGGDSTQYYTVKFVQEGCANIEYTIKAGDSLPNVPNPQPKVGYTVTWESFDSTNITQDVTIEAVATPNDYLITYQLATDDGETMEGALTQTVTYDAAYELATPAKANYNFLGWASDSTVLAQSGVWKIAEDVTLSAVWAEACYTIVFVQTDGTTVTRMVEIGKTIAETEIPEPISAPGYDVAWSVTDFSTITENARVTVVKTAKTFNATYNLATDETMEDSTADSFMYGTEYTLKTPEKAGYTFRYWKLADGTVVPSEGTWNYTTDLNLTAEWTANSNLITFVQADGTVEERTVSTGGSLAEKDVPKAKQVDGYTVTWSVTDFSNITGAMTVTAVKTPNNYVITYVVPEDKTIDGTKQTIAFNSSYELPTPTREYYNFIGWKNAEGVIVEQKGTWSLAADQTLTASWVEDFYTVTFIQIDGEKITRIVEKGAALTDIPTCKGKAGHAVVWSVEDFSKIESDLTVIAVATPNTYKVTYTLTDGESIVGTLTVTLTYGQTYTLETPKHTNSKKKFVRWVNAETNQEVPMTGTWTFETNITLRAEWKTVEEEGWTGNY